MNKMRQPDTYSASAIKNWENGTLLSNGAWVPARPYGHNAFSFIWRFKLAWSVLTGKADCLTWEK